MTFPAGVEVTRLRRHRIPAPENPERQMLGPWSDADSIAITGAYVASVSSFAAADPVRSKVNSTKSLYCDPSADVKVGDRIVSGSHTYEVVAVPEADVNPFTGWQPTQEIALTEVLG